MSFTPFRQRAIDLSPGFLREGTGERWDYMMGLCIDASLERAYQCTTCHFPLRAGGDAQDQIGRQNLLITRGLTESDASYGVRLQHALDSWALAGTAHGILPQVLGYFLALTPMVRLVSSRYNTNPAVQQWQLANVIGVPIANVTNASPIVITTAVPHGVVTGTVTIAGVLGTTAANGTFSKNVLDDVTIAIAAVGNGSYLGGGRLILTTDLPSVTYPNARLSSSWDSYPVGRSLDAEPEHALVTASGGNFDWDSLSPVTGSYGYWGSWLILYSVAPNDWTAPAQAWGLGSTYTGSGDYSTITSGAYVATGSYTGSTQAWGDGSVYNGSGDYSRVQFGIYTNTGYYSGVSQAWGLSVSTDYVQSVALIAAQFKASLNWIRYIVVCFDAALFDPAQPAGGGINPDGTWGNWSIITSAAYVESRFTDAVYGGEVL